MANKNRCSKNTKTKFLNEIDDMSSKELDVLINELLTVCDVEIFGNNKALPNRTRKTYGQIKARYVRSKKISKIQMFKLYLIAYYDKRELEHWLIDGSQCDRINNIAQYRAQQREAALRRKQKKRERGELNNDTKWDDKRTQDALKEKTMYHRGYRAGHLSAIQQKKNWY